MILLNDILNLPSPRNVKLRFNISFGTNRPAIDYFTDNTKASTKQMLEGITIRKVISQWVTLYWAL